MKGKHGNVSHENPLKLGKTFISVVVIWYDGYRTNGSYERREFMLNYKLSHYLSTLTHKGLYRQRHCFLNTEDALLFSSNDYLSLTNDPRVKEAYQFGFEQYPTGSGASMVVCGYHAIHQQLEQAFATALNVDNCLLFSSGFAANLSVMGLLAQLDVTLLVDKAVHASIYDGLKLANAHCTRFLHNDLTDLVLKLQASRSNAAIVTESTFSMSGQMSPLKAINALAKQHDAALFVDEAHAFGVRGAEGLGAVVEAGLTQHDVPLRIIPLGKAFGAQGAIVAGQEPWIEALLQSARPYIYSTAISPAMAYGLMATLPIVQQADDRRQKLAALVSYFRDAIKNSPLQWRDSLTPIQQLQLGCPHLALSYAKKLRERAIICLAMRQPTVSKIDTGLRVMLNYHHQPEHIDYLFKCLHEH